MILELTTSGVDKDCVYVCILSCVQFFVTPWTNSSPPGSSVRGIIQAKMLKWVAVSYSRVSPEPRDQTHISHVSCTCRQILYLSATKWSLGNVIWAPGSSCAWVVVTWANRWSWKLTPFGVRLVSLATKDILSDKTYIISLWQMENLRLRGGKLPAQGHTLSKQRS